MTFDETMMARAVSLARKGLSDTSPNPMVGCVITEPDGTIIGEGYHRRCGEGHAEVNTVAMVADKSRLRHATVYVTLEPCAHQGRTPPCATMLASHHIARVVVGCVDPNPLVAGRGIGILRDSGAEVVTGVLERECRELNPKFLTAFGGKRPYVTLKWAQSLDGFMDCRRVNPNNGAMRFSSALGTVEVHRLRALHDAILTGSGTIIADNPQLNVRLWDGRQPLRIVLDRSGRLTSGYRVFEGGRTLLCAPRPINDTEWLAYTRNNDLPWLLEQLRSRGITSLMVEGGASVLHSFVESGLWDYARIETSPLMLGENGTAPAPRLDISPLAVRNLDGRSVAEYKNPRYKREFLS